MDIIPQVVPGSMAGLAGLYLSVKVGLSVLQPKCLLWYQQPVTFNLHLTNT